MSSKETNNSQILMTSSCWQRQRRDARDENTGGEEDKGRKRECEWARGGGEEETDGKRERAKLNPFCRLTVLRMPASSGATGITSTTFTAMLKTITGF